MAPYIFLSVSSDFNYSNNRASTKKKKYSNSCFAKLKSIKFFLIIRF